MTPTRRDRPAPDYDVVVVGARCAGGAWEHLTGLGDAVGGSRLEVAGAR